MYTTATHITSGVCHRVQFFFPLCVVVLRVATGATFALLRHIFGHMPAEHIIACAKHADALQFQMSTLRTPVAPPQMCTLQNKQ